MNACRVLAGAREIRFRRKARLRRRGGRGRGQARIGLRTGVVNGGFAVALWSPEARGSACEVDMLRRIAGLV